MLILNTDYGHDKFQNLKNIAETLPSSLLTSLTRFQIDVMGLGNRSQNIYIGWILVNIHLFEAIGLSSSMAVNQCFYFKQTMFQIDA